VTTLAAEGPESASPLIRELFIGDDSVGAILFATGQPELPVGTKVYLYLPGGERTLECRDGKRAACSSSWRIMDSRARMSTY